MTAGKAFILRCIAAAKRHEAMIADEEAAEIEAQERERAFRFAWAQYAGLKTTRSKALAKDYAVYLANAWQRERDMARLPDSASQKRKSLHRFAKSREGKSLSWRAIFDIATIYAADRFETASQSMRIDW